MLRRFFTYGNLAVAGLWATLAVHEVPERAPKAISRAVEPVRLSLEDQWRRASGVVLAALAGFERVKTLHAAAAQQLDAVDYSLAQLIEDLRPAMALPADVAGLRAWLPRRRFPGYPTASPLPDCHPRLYAEDPPPCLLRRSP
ncbi:MAG: hypothetical protein WDN31_19800 [Hyphomicrobium sp.]